MQTKKNLNRFFFYYISLLKKIRWTFSTPKVVFYFTFNTQHFKNHRSILLSSFRHSGILCMCTVEFIFLLGTACDVTVDADERLVILDLLPLPRDFSDCLLPTRPLFWWLYELLKKKGITFESKTFWSLFYVKQG